MKRLLHIAGDIAINSIFYALTWLIISVLIDKNLINIFIITYPLQFVVSVLKSGFSIGANISKIKENNGNAIPSGMITGIILGAIIFIILIINIDTYLNYMNADISTYKIFSIYVISQLYTTMVLKFTINNLYFKKENQIASRRILIFNVMNFLCITILSLITKQQSLIVLFSIIPMFIFSFYYFFKDIPKFNFDLNVIFYCKYDLEEAMTRLFFIIMYFFGISTIYTYDPKYALALSFVSLVSDVQWDVLYASSTLAKIDISENNFNYTNHKKITYKLLIILLFIGTIVFILLYQFYQISIILALIYYSFDIIAYCLFPFYKIKTLYLQLEYSVKKITINKLISNIIRLFCSLLLNPFCTGIALLSSVIYQSISTHIIFNNNFKINKNGFIEKKNS